MTKSPLSKTTNSVVYAFPPLEIEPVVEGYQLRFDPYRQMLLAYVGSTKKGGIRSFVIIVTVMLAAFFYAFWPILVPVIIFGVVYGSLKLIFDPESRYFAARFACESPEIIFSHYPLRIGENDRLIFRRKLKDKAWLSWFNIKKFPENSYLKISLICVERISYTQGTDVMTEVATIYEERIYAHSVIGGDRQVKAYFDLHIPEQFPPSFEGKTNQIRWLFKIEETYPNAFGQLTTYLTFTVDP
jgi:hypothetical protein